MLLEARLRKAVNAEGMTGTQLAYHAFNPEKGPLGKHWSGSTSEREGVRDLFVGAFKLFRNPTAHGAVGYSPAEGRAILGLINLLLLMLKRVEDMPPVGSFPEHLEVALAKVEKAIGPAATGRLRTFLGRCVGELGIDVRSKGKQWIPFRHYALCKAKGWEKPRPHRISVFYLVVMDSGNSIRFPTDYYYPWVVGFNKERMEEELAELGFKPAGRNMIPYASLKTHNDQSFFDSLFECITEICGELEETLHTG